jgi:tRNA-dihydrouridine synthase C
VNKGLPADFWQGPDRIVLAPMEGVVDAVMRDLLTRIGGIDLCVTEFIRVTDRFLPDSEYQKYCPELFESEGCQTRAGVPMLAQFLGGQPGPMAENAARAAELGAAGIDLNFGCPAKTVNRHDGGASILKDPCRIHDIVSAVRRAVPAHIPVSAKVRLGFSDKSHHVEIAQGAESGGAAWLTVHARTRDEGYRPPAHWEYIARMREAVKMTVICNGEIWNEEDYARARDASGCRHAMIGRGLMSSPDLARKIKGLAPLAEWSEVVPWVIEFGELSRSYRHDLYAVCRVKQWLKSLSRRFAEAPPLFEKIKTLQELNPMLEICRDSLRRQEPYFNIESSLPA